MANCSSSPSAAKAGTGGAVASLPPEEAARAPSMLRLSWAAGAAALVAARGTGEALDVRPAPPISSCCRRRFATLLPTPPIRPRAGCEDTGMNCGLDLHEIGIADLDEAMIVMDEAFSIRNSARRGRARNAPGS